jgi:ABC-type multidrug transport system ATPase subunit/pSer/pThr/pTyr-binding forkhead associated (FHA) protein
VSGRPLTVVAAGRTATIEGEERLTLGSAEDADIRFADERISPHHALILREGEAWVLHNVSSRGIFVDGRRVETVSISRRVTVRLGDAADGPLLELAPAASTRTETQLVEGVAAPPTATARVGPERSMSGAFSGIHPALGAIARLGREPDNDIVVDDLLVSRHHAELREAPEGGYELVDLGSRNGTFVNGRRVERARLEELDVVAIGRRLFRLVGTGLEEFVDEGLITFEAAGLTVTAPSGGTLLDDVSFSLDERAFLAVVGPSGAGKSTLLGALTGFRPAKRGAVLYDGRDLYANYDELRLRIGFVPQEDILHDPLTVWQTLAYAAELRFPEDVGAEDRAGRVDELMAELGLADVGALRVDQLSGGQRRRVAVGVELLTTPTLLFLDEPTSGLDPGYERSLMTLLRELADGGRTVVVVTHSVRSIRLCDRVLFLAPGGRTAYFGPPQLAPAYFEREDFEQIFQDLSGDRGRDWTESFRAHPDFERYVRHRAPEAHEQKRSSRIARAISSFPRPGSWLAQFGVLTRRYARVLTGDRRNLALLLLQPIVLGLLMLAALPPGELAAPDAGETRALSRAGLVLLIVVLGTTWLGASNAVREIARELPIVRRERSAGLSVSAYIASKAVVLGVLTAAQSTVLVTLALARQGSHDEGSLLPSPLPELILAGTLAGLAAMALGLLISALASTVDRAMTVLPVVLILQLLLAMGGVFPDVVDKPVLKEGSHLAGTQWAFSAAASTVDLGRLQALDAVAREAPAVRLDEPAREFESLVEELRSEPRWDHDTGTWLWNAAALGALTFAALAGVGLALRRRRPEA